MKTIHYQGEHAPTKPLELAIKQSHSPHSSNWRQHIYPDGSYDLIVDSSQPEEQPK